MLQVALMVILIIMCGVCVVVMSKCDVCSQTGFFKRELFQNCFGRNDYSAKHILLSPPFPQTHPEQISVLLFFQAQCRRPLR
jgi:hypothetical protein